MPNREPMTAARVERIREALGLTQAALAEATGSNIRTVQRWLAGDRTPRGAAVRLLETMEAKAGFKARAAGK